MPIDPSIPLQSQPTTRVASPAELLGQVLAIQRAQQEQQSGALELQEKKRAMAAQDALDSAIAGSLTQRSDGTWAPNTDKIRMLLSQGPGAHLLPALEKSWAEGEKAHADIVQLRQKMAEAEADDVGRLAARGLAVLDHGGTPDDAAGAILPDIAAHVKNEALGRDTGVNIVTQLDKARSDPQTLRNLFQEWQRQSDAQRKVGSEEATSSARTSEAATAALKAPPEIAEKTAKALQEQQILENMKGGVTAEQREQNALRAKELGIQAGHLAVARDRLNKEAAVPDLTPAGIDAVATAFAKTGQMPPMGMGNKAAELRVKIINRAAELRPDIDLASSKADYDANKGSLVTLQRQRDAVVAFEQTANQNLDRFLETAKGVVDSGSPLINQPLRSVSRNVIGSDKIAAFDAARLVAQNEIAKVTSNPNLAGQLSDAARKEVEAALSPNASLKQIYSVAKILRADMETRREAMDAQLSAIQTRIKESAPTPTMPTIRRFNPITGKLE